MKKKIIVGSTVIVAILACLYFSPFVFRRCSTVPEPVSIEKLPPRLEYGLPVDSFIVMREEVGRGENISSILSRYGITAVKIDSIVKASEGIFDLRRIKRGNEYHLYFSCDTQYRPQHFVYMDTPLDYVRIDFNGQVKVTKNQVPVRTERKKAATAINQSLWATMYANNYNPLLALELSEIFAWTVDFFAIQAGDSFCVVYDEQFVDSVSIGIAAIHAAYFSHQGNTFYAIPFEQDSIRQYFDLNGESLRRAFLKAPLRFSRISSRFSHSRLHPVLRIRRPHHGVDYAAPVGTPVFTIGDGTVISAGYSGGAGYMVKVRHNSVYSSSYLHLSRFAKGVRKGARVAQGQVIGYVGSTGLSTGPHLDFRMYKNGSPTDPLKVKAPPVEPVSQANKAAFDSVRNSAVGLLRSL